MKDINVTLQLRGLIEPKANGINLDDTQRLQCCKTDERRWEFEITKGLSERLRNEKYHMMSSQSDS